MKRLIYWALCLCLMQAIVARAQKPELHLPSVTVGKSVYSNVVLKASGTNRISVEHPLGLATIKVASLDLEVAQQLLAAGVISEAALKGNTNYQAWLKEEKLAERQRQKAANPPGVVARYAGMDGSAGEELAGRLERAVNAHGGFDPDVYIARLGVWGVVGFVVGAGFFYLLRCWCLFRIVKKSLGSGSALVFLPLVWWFPLLRAADMSRHLLWLPAFGLAMLYCQPPMPATIPWAEPAYDYATRGLWALIALLYVVWCFKVCRKAGGNPLLGLLLIFPLLEWIPLLYLALSDSGESKSAASAKGKAGSARPVFAI